MPRIVCERKTQASKLDWSLRDSHAIFHMGLKRESKMEGILAEFEGGGHFVLSFSAYA